MNNAAILVIDDEVQIRRLLESVDISVLRLVRVGIGRLQLGKLAKGEWRRLGVDEVADLK